MDDAPSPSPHPTPAPPTITIALAGNPNSGKTTLFNALTGANQHVGNYPGVTVETKEGTFRHGPYTVRVIDLPGTYSLTAYSIEEIVARNIIIHQRPDLVVDVIDSSNLERNLYLALQFKELQVPLVLALNMADEMHARGIKVNIPLLSRQLGAPIVPTIGTRKKGINKLIEKIIEVASGRWQCPDCPPLTYGPEIENELEKIALPFSREDIPLSPNRPSSTSTPSPLVAAPRWIALKLLENDREIHDSLRNSPIRPLLDAQLETSRQRLTTLFGEDPETVIAEHRYGCVHGLARTVIQQRHLSRFDLTERVDRILTNRLAGLPLFAILMYLTFFLVFTLGEVPMAWIESTFAALAALIADHWPTQSAPLLRSLLLDGIIAGVGGVLVFVPNLVLLFTAITLLEDTGYMARAAFLMDRLMKWIGLHGKSFIPMLTGFGCTVPAILGTRILDNRRDRFTTLLVLPLISCSARLPIYLLIIPAFFPPHWRAPMMYLIYLIGILLAILCARLLRSTLLKGDPSPFVMELPPYRLPTARAVLIHVWQRTRLYLRKAGTLILAFSIIMWALAAFPQAPPEKLQNLEPAQARETALRYSLTGRLGRALEPLIRPLGFDWKIGTALIGAVPAKELFVSQMGIVYALGDAEDNAAALRQTLRQHYSPLTGFCIMLYALIATPCLATIAVTRRETASWRWTLLQFAGLTLLAWLLTLIVYQTGSLLHIGTG